MFNETTSSIAEGHKLIDEILANIRETISEPLLDGVEAERPITREKVIAQIIMEHLISDANVDESQRVSLARIADHLGPHYAQDLYRAAVLITKMA